MTTDSTLRRDLRVLFNDAANDGDYLWETYKAADGQPAIRMRNFDELVDRVIERVTEGEMKERVAHFKAAQARAKAWREQVND